MNNQKRFRKMFALLLTFAMIFSNLSMTLAANLIDSSDYTELISSDFEDGDIWEFAAGGGTTAEVGNRVSGNNTAFETRLDNVSSLGYNGPLDYTFLIEEEDFSGYQYTDGQEMDKNTIGWEYVGGSANISLTYQEDDGISYAKCYGGTGKADGGSSYYFAKSFDMGMEDQVIVEFDAEFIEGETLIHLMSAGNVTRWPASPVALSYNAVDEALMYGTIKVMDLPVNTWAHIKLEVDLQGKTVDIYTKSGEQQQVLADLGLLDESELNIQSFVVLPRANGTVNVTDVTMGYYNENPMPVVGEIIKNEYPESIEETQQRIDNYVPVQRQMEKLNRGLVAVKVENGVYLSWRWLATESKDIAYNIYRDGEKVNALPIADSTNYLDTAGTSNSTYTIRTVVNGGEQELSEAVSTWEQQYLSIPLQIPEDGTTPDGVDYTYSANDSSVADLDGDGDYEIVLKWDPSNSRDNNGGYTGPAIFDAYEMDGTLLWRINMGPNVTAGPHYTQFIVYDLDQDGKAEVTMRTSDGTVDGEGNVIGDPNADYWNDAGYVLTGNEFLTVFDGATGEALDTIDFEPARGKVSDWGDDYGNRVDRFLAGVAYLDGVHPSLIMTRGYYEKTMLVAYDWENGKINKGWVFDSDEEGEEYTSQGNHQLSVNDVDYDGKDEVTFGAMAIDDNGEPLYTTGLGHGDALHVADLDPNRPGLEVFQPHEHIDAEYGIEFRDARTGETIWGSFEGVDVGRGVAGDIDPNYYGAEAWGADKLLTADGDLIKEGISISQNFLVWWDGDLGRELLDQNRIDKWDAEEEESNIILIDREVASNNSTKSNPCLTADLIGDWREEVIWRTEDSSALRMYTTTEPTDYKIYTLMQNPQYRQSIAWQNVAYNQPPHTSFYLGFDTKTIPVPQVYTIDNGNKVENTDLNLMKYDIDDLTKQGDIATFIGSHIALLKDQVVQVDSENEGTVVVEDGTNILVPTNFVSSVLEEEVDTNWNQTTIDGVTYVVLEDVVNGLDKNLFTNDAGLVYISDDAVSFTEEQANLLMNQLKHAVYIVDEGDILYQGPRLRENHLLIKAVEASSNDGNLPEGAVDSDFNTRWASFGAGEWLWLDLGEVQPVEGIAATFYKGDERSYSFDIEVSIDNENWTTVLSTSSSGTTLDLEDFMFDETVEMRYMRYVGKENSVNGYNNIYEFLVLGDLDVSPVQLTPIKVNAPIFKNQNGEVITSLEDVSTVNVSVTMENTIDQDSSATLIAALYNADDVFIDYVTVDKIISANASVGANVELSLSQAANGHYIKVFVWNSLENMQPLTKSVLFQ